MFATTGKRAGWERYDDERKSFHDMKAAQSWLAEEYGTAKRVPMYCDRKDAPPMRIGYVIGFRVKHRTKGDPVAEQHWVEFRECNLVNMGEF
jgi:hypothetical protein